MWVNIPDPPQYTRSGYDHYNYGIPFDPSFQPREGKSKLQEMKEHMRFIRACMAEEERKEKKKEEEKKKKDEKKGSPSFNLQPVFFWTMPLTGLGTVYFLHAMATTLDTILK